MSAAILHRNKTRWTTERVAGVEVLMSDSVGPAVVGLLRPRIVVPRWVAATVDWIRGSLRRACSRCRTMLQPPPPEPDKKKTRKAKAEAEVPAESPEQGDVQLSADTSS